MLWLIAGIVLLIIAIAGGAIIHPVLFALAIGALVIFSWDAAPAPSEHPKDLSARFAFA